jgi:NitT/TauT family transport system substrate-binding protein
MKKLVLPILLISIIGIFILSGCSKEECPQNVQVKVGTWKTAQTIQPFFYQKFINNSYNIEVLPFTNPGDQKTALLAGSLDMCGTTVVTAIAAASNGEPVVIVSGLCNKCSALVVRNDSNIKRETDLKGKKIAYVPGSMHHALLLEVLKRNGLDPQKDVELKRIDFFDMGQALSQGTVDAFCSGEPYPSIAIAEGYGRILTYPYYDDNIGTINGAMITSRDKIKNNPKLIQDLVIAHAKATEYLKMNQNDWISKAAEFGTDKKVLDVSAKNIDLSWDINENYINNTKNLADRMKALGIISQIPDIDALFDCTFVKHAQEELMK